VLAAAAWQARARGGGLGVVSPRPRIRRLFAITGLDRQIWLARTVAEALAVLPPGWDMPLDGPHAGSHSPS
jgi:anti-anti-sigma regulatory factor